MQTLYWSRRGRVSCPDHSPAVGSHAWSSEGWQEIPATAYRHGIEYQCDRCHAGLPIRPHTKHARGVSAPATFWPPTVTVAPAVLLVQPDRDDREMYVEFLRCRGLETIECSDTAVARSLVPHAAVVVTALNFVGEMNGVDLIAYIKQTPEIRGLPVIVLTATVGLMEHALAAGCDAFLSKPCLPERLLREIRHLLGRQDRKQEWIEVPASPRRRRA